MYLAREGGGILLEGIVEVITVVEDIVVVGVVVAVVVVVVSVKIVSSFFAPFSLFSSMESPLSSIEVFSAIASWKLNLLLVHPLVFDIQLNTWPIVSRLFSFQIGEPPVYA